MELINRGYINEEDIQVFYYYDLFKELLQDNSYKDLVQIIHYIVNINRLNIDADDLWDNRDDLIELYKNITNKKDDFER